MITKFAASVAASVAAAVIVAATTHPALTVTVSALIVIDVACRGLDRIRPYGVTKLLGLPA